MSYYRVVVPGWHPTSTNELNRNRYAASRLKGQDRRQLAWVSYVTRVPRATGARRVTLTIGLGPGQRGCDPDNYWKSLLDACVRVGWLLDDRRQCVEARPVQFEHADRPYTIIELEDIETCNGPQPLISTPSSACGGTAAACRTSRRSGSRSRTRTPRDAGSPSAGTGRTGSGRRGGATS